MTCDARLQEARISDTTKWIMPVPDTRTHDTMRLNKALLIAHDTGDRAALVQLYQQAGEQHEAAGDIDAACFYLTHAYVFALEAGFGQADAIKAKLIRYGREE
jgi:hypothetical protein